jgi:hypothetical protein
VTVCETGPGDDALYRLTYVSDIVAVSLETLDVTLRQILIQSHVLNIRDDITGFLITYRGCYAQALEGPRAAVEACYARIAGDPRHTRLAIKSRGLVGQRLFPQWSMCGLTLSARDAGVLASAEQAFDLDPRAAAPQAVVQFLEEISRRYNDQADRLYRTLREV